MVDVEGFVTVQFSVLNGDVDTDWILGLKGEVTWLTNSIFVWTALLLNLCVMFTCIDLSAVVCASCISSTVCKTKKKTNIMLNK